MENKRLSVVERVCIDDPIYGVALFRNIDQAKEYLGNREKYHTIKTCKVILPNKPETIKEIEAWLNSKEVMAITDTKEKAQKVRMLIETKYNGMIHCNSCLALIEKMIEEVQ